jgi:hypothetical protein
MSIEMVAARGLARLIDLIHSNSLSSFSLQYIILPVLGYELLLVLRLIATSSPAYYFMSACITSF